ncbi:integrase [Mycolicibacterium fortuitum]|uniref:Integrase n=1 Tax=Mycolicibacterium fortuitum TaxID=1766 RepID=A0ABD6QK91_MYCFO|nr:site-specific integrase [Mycolicibacterium fortuitum]OMC43096.1 integrase [Mycolicibacterium fortuitum]
MAFKRNPAKKTSQRAKGEGSVFQRKSDGMWVGSIELGYDEHGKRKQKRVYAKDYRTLIDKLDEAKSERSEGLTLDRSTTVAKWLDYWLPHIQKERVRPTTYTDNGWTVKNISRTIGHKKLIDLQPSDVRAMHTQLGKGRRRTAKAHILLGQALTSAIAEGLIKRNVVTVVDTPDVAQGERKPFTVEQTQQLLAQASETNPMEYTRWLLAFLTGARQGECLGLTWDRVDLENSAVDITWQLQQLKRVHGCGEKTDNGWPCGRKNGSRCTDPRWDMPIKFQYEQIVDSLVFTRPKSEAGKRWIPIIKPLRDALEHLRDIDCGPNPHNLVFHRADGYPVTPTEDNRAWNALLQAAGISTEGTGLTMHSARKTAATVLRAAGADEQTRMEILGHNSPEVARIYAHADQAKNATMMDALAVLLPPKELG